jgi:F0F1-type ATP synthase membrane subunit b/b'
MFGGIEAEKNSSLEYLETIQKKITKTMEKAQANHMKIYQAIATVKASLTELNENYLAISKESKHSGGLISKLTCEITDILQDVSE